MRAAIYCGGRNHKTISELKAMANERGYDAHSYTMSGRGVGRLIQDIENGHVGIILAGDVMELMHGSSYLPLVYTLAKRGIKIITPKGTLDFRTHPFFNAIDEIASREAQKQVRSFAQKAGYVPLSKIVLELLPSLRGNGRSNGTRIADGLVSFKDVARIMTGKIGTGQSAGAEYERMLGFARSSPKLSEYLHKLPKGSAVLTIDGGVSNKSGFVLRKGEVQEFIELYRAVESENPPTARRRRSGAKKETTLAEVVGLNGRKPKKSPAVVEKAPTTAAKETPAEAEEAESVAEEAKSPVPAAELRAKPKPKGTLALEENVEENLVSLMEVVRKMTGQERAALEYNKLLAFVRSRPPLFAYLKNPETMHIVRGSSGLPVSGIKYVMEKEKADEFIANYNAARLAKTPLARRIPKPKKPTSVREDDGPIIKVEVPKDQEMTVEDILNASDISRLDGGGISQRQLEEQIRGILDGKMEGLKEHKGRLILFSDDEKFAVDVRDYKVVSFGKAADIIAAIQRRGVRALT